VFEEAYIGYFFHLKWSPDSQNLLIEPEVEDNCGCMGWSDTRVFNLMSDTFLNLTDRSRHVNGGGFTWTANNLDLIYSDKGVDILEIRLDGIRRQPLVNFETDPPPDVFPTACNFAWSQQRTRLYYAAGCLRQVDDPLNALYSVDLSGNWRVEAFLPDLLRKEFPLPVDYTPYVEDLNVAIIHPTESTIYAAFGFKVMAPKSSDPGSDFDLQSFWRVIRLNAPGEIQTVFEFTAPNILSSMLVYASFTPDNQKVALADTQHIVVGDLMTGAQLVDQPRMLNNYSMRSGVVWIDDEQLLYATDDDIWLLNTSDGTTANLTADIESIAYLLPQTNSYTYEE
jgi:hypothetical protein